MSRKKTGPLTGPKLALAGRVVTMDDAATVWARGVIYVDAGRIVAVADATGSPPAPPGFAGVAPVEVGGTIFPGLIELHNHLTYNALRLWDVPRRFANRDQWSGIPEYRTLISGPMTVVGQSPGLLPAVVRYVECKCLLGGVTTSQGIELFSNAGARRYYKGALRTVEQTLDLDLPEAATKIADVEAGDVNAFFTRLRRQTCFLLHLSEGTDAAARAHFLALQMPGGDWAITDALAGIHCAALRREDFAVLAAHGGAMVWSPLSNLLLYGATADIAAARAEGVRLGIGSDWSPSGSKNLLGELKVARLVSRSLGGVLADVDLVAMATRNAAAILKWDKALGSIEPGKHADLLVVARADGDPYAALIESKETDLRLVMIGGVPRHGEPKLMRALGVTKGEAVSVGGQARTLFLDQATEDPAIGPVTLAEAAATLTDALARLPELSKALESRPAPAFEFRVGPQPVTWRLALDELIPGGLELRPHLPAPRTRLPTGPTLAVAAQRAPLSQLLKPLELDPVTVADDPDFLARIAAAKNLPAFLKTGLPTLY
jgi:cytosine/adenosine deaminase-related metal-dependent hydrolase